MDLGYCNTFPSSGNASQIRMLFIFLSRSYPASPVPPA